MGTRKRIIEIYVGRSFGSDCGDWWVTDVEVPADWDRERGVEYALQQVQDKLAGDELIAFTGLYCYWDDGGMAPMWEEAEDWDESQDGLYYDDTSPDDPMFEDELGRPL